MSGDAGPTVDFRPPGPGGWKALADHFPGAVTAEYQAIYAETCRSGMATYMERYGVLARGVDVGFVHGHLYITPRPIAGPRAPRGTPPAALVWLLARLHPEFRRRTHAAARALAERPWRGVTAHWFETERHTWERRALDGEAVDVAALSDRELADHLTAVRSFVVDGYRRHFELHGDDLLPIGLLLARCAEWDIGPATALSSLGRPDGAAPGVHRGWQLATGYDLDSVSWHELGISPTPPPVGGDPTDADLRELVDERHHPELAELIADARAAIPLRDDNGALTGAWPMGLLRRSMLEAGRRLGLDDPGVAVDATVAELTRRLDRHGGPSNAELVDRRADRRWRSSLDAPRTLGPEFALPPLDPLPRPLALIGAAQIAVSDHMLDGPTPVGVGTDPHVGRAVVVEDPNEALALVEPGDVVVTQTTSPAWNSILVHAGAVVTTTGGLVSHAAIVARELGIPAVIGDPGACDRLTTGMTVLVDPTTATTRPVDA